MDGAREVRSEKLREHQFIEGYAKSLESRKVEWDGKSNVEQYLRAGEAGDGRQCKRGV